MPQKRFRIISGALRRRFIPIPKSLELTTRPTSDIVKQAMFNILIHRYSIDFSKAMVIDLFAGTGSLGLEAISCGCTKALFIDSNKNAIACIKQTLKTLNIGQFANTICEKAQDIPDQILLDLSRSHDRIIVFMDPPYADKRLLLSQVERFRGLFVEAPQKLVIVAESDKEISKNGFSEASFTMKHGIKFINILVN